MMKKSVPRRAVLRGIGAAVALPFLDAMVPALAGSGRNATSSACRLAFLYVSNGIIMKDWTPAAEGSKFEFPRTLKPVERFRENLLVLSGLDHYNGQALGDGPGDHARAGATWLTGAHPKKTQGSDIMAGISADQIAARKIGVRTTLPSLELGLEDNRMVGNCDSGYSCAYSNTVSWSSPVTPLPIENNPRALFERLFGDGETTDAAARALQLRQDRSILDFVREDAARLGMNLGARDRARIGEYLDTVREIERRIQAVELQNEEGDALPSIDRPDGIPPTFEEHAGLMFDLVAVAFQADLTRIATLMLGREGSNRTYRSIGVPDAHHGLSHHFNETHKIEKLQKIDQHHVEILSRFLERLNTTIDGDAPLLDRSLVLYGSSLSDGNRHDHFDLPALLAGGRSFGIHGGRHIRFGKGTPMANLLLAMLEAAGAPAPTLGDSTGTLDLRSDGS
jgi:hypothetical protein